MTPAEFIIVFLDVAAWPIAVLASALIIRSAWRGSDKAIIDEVKKYVREAVRAEVERQKALPSDARGGDEQS